MGRSRFACLDCGVDTGKINQHYMLRDEIWAQVHDTRVGMFCIGCVETRLGRTLVSADFAPVKINHPKVSAMSARLLDRIGPDGPPRPGRP